MREINILIHGYTEGFNSEFMQFLYTSLKNAGKEVCGFDFDYINNNTQPSLDFNEEHTKLIKIIEEYKSRGYTKINLIGKSLGGTFCLNDTIANDPYINKIALLGLPLSLGYPANLEILNNKTLLKSSTTFDDYKNQFSKIGNNLEKVVIVQGENDLLGDLKDVNRLINETSNKAKLITIKNASHGFKPVDSSTSFSSNCSILLGVLLEILS